VVAVPVAAASSGLLFCLGPEAVNVNYTPSFSTHTNSVSRGDLWAAAGGGGGRRAWPGHQ
jgi:hypothetical protein